MFLKVCKCFHIVGSFYSFFFYMSEMSIAWMMKHAETLYKVLSRPLDSTPLELYINAENRLQYKPKDVEEEEPTDEMMMLIRQVSEEQESKLLKEKDDKIKKIMAAFNAEKRKEKEENKKQEKKKQDEEDFEITITGQEQEKIHEELENAAYLKSLSEYFDPSKKLEDMGDKNFDSQ